MGKSRFFDIFSDKEAKSRSAIIASTAVVYLNVPLSSGVIKYPKNTPVAAAGAYTAGIPAISESPKGTSLSAITAREAISPVMTESACHATAQARSLLLPSAFAGAFLVTSFNFNHRRILIILF